MWPAILLVLFVVTNVQKLRLDAEERGDEPERVRLREGLVALGRDDGAAAARIAQEILATARSARLKHDAAQLLAWGSILSGDADRAAQALGMFPPELPPSPYLRGAVFNATDHPEEAVLPLEQAWRQRPDAATGTQLAHALVRSGRLGQALALLSGRHSSRLGVDAFAIVEKSLFDAGRFAEAAQVGELGFAHHPDPTLAYNAACSFARAGRPTEAVAWLERAIAAGYRDPVQMEADPDLDSLRGVQEYRTLRERLRAPG
jgi:thioredoxin-like negative regulator of GroEL